MNSVINNVIIDFDFLFDKEIQILVYLNKDKEVKDVCKLIDKYVYDRVFTHDNNNPGELYGIEGFDLNSRFMNSLSVEPMISSRKLELIDSFISSDSCKVNILCNDNSIEKELVSTYISDKGIEFIYKDSESLIDMTKYDTIYFRTCEVLDYLDFNNCERRALYTENIRCNFLDDDKQVLRFEYLPIGLKNDIHVISTYDIEKVSIKDLEEELKKEVE